MACENIIGVKNIVIVFRNCDNGFVSPPISHKLANDQLPMWRTYGFRLEKLPGGYMKKHHISPSCDINLIRDLRMSLEDYQGRSAIDIQVEYDNGLVFTGENGGIEGEELSDSHDVSLKIGFRSLVELLPPGALSPTN